MDPFDAGWLSLLPPIIAITLALITKEVISSLFLGILFSGHHEKIAQICQKKDPENHALHKGNPAAGYSESQQKRRNRKHEGNLIMKRRTLDRHIGNYRRDSQYNQNV